jgi:hypothetical protein
MTGWVFTELLGGRVLTVEDLDPASLDAIGGSSLAGPLGPSRLPDGSVLVAEVTGHSIAQADPGDTWQRLGAQGNGIFEFERPTATAVLSGGQLVVIDSGNRRMVSMASIGGAGWVTFGRPGVPDPGDPGVGLFLDPRGVAVDSVDRIWITDPGLRRLVRLDDIQGDGWTEVALPAGAAPVTPYGIAAHGDGVAVVDVGNARLIVLDADGAVSETVSIAGPSWRSPAFVTSLGSGLVVADVVTNTLWLLEDQGAGLEQTGSLRGSPPDQVQPLFDSIGGVAG